MVSEESSKREARNAEEKTRTLRKPLGFAFVLAIFYK